MLLLVVCGRKVLINNNAWDVYLEFVRDLPDVVEIQVLQNLDFRKLVQFIEVGGGDEVGGGGLGGLGGGPRGGGVLEAEGCQGRKARVHLAARRHDGDRRSERKRKSVSLSLSRDAPNLYQFSHSSGDNGSVKSRTGSACD
jgi:hypothetical protein